MLGGPEGLESIVGVLTFILPGFVAYQLIYRHCVPARAESQFVLTAKSLIWSLCIYAMLAATATLWNYIAVPRDWSPWSVNFSAWPTIITALMLATITGGFAAKKGPRWLEAIGAWLGASRTWHPDVWAYVLHSPEKPLFLFVEMNDGSVFYGAVEKYTDDPNAALREILLTNVYEYPEGLEGKAMDCEGSIYLSLGSVKLLRIPMTQPTQGEVMQEESRPTSEES